MRKIICILLLSFFAIFLSIESSVVKAETLNGWHQLADGPKFFENGQFLTGKQTVGRTTYLFDGNGLKQSGWHKLDGKDYYFDSNSNGGMATGKRKIGNTTYLFHNEGYKIFGWHRLNGKDYYFDSTFGGGMVTGKRKIGNTTYLLHNDGHKSFGWHRLNGKDYYFDSNFGGGMVTGKRKIGQTTYLMHNDGYKIYGWARLNGRDYYFDPDFGGGMITGQRQVGNSIYLFDKSGFKINIISSLGNSVSISKPITSSQFESFKNEINSNTYPFARIYQPEKSSSKKTDIIIDGFVGTGYFYDYHDIEWAYDLIMSYLSTTDYYVRGVNMVDYFEIQVNLVKSKEQLAYEKLFNSLEKELSDISYVNEVYKLYEDRNYNTALSVWTERSNPNMNSNEQIQKAYDSITAYLKSKNLDHEIITGRGFFDIKFNLK